MGNVHLLVLFVVIFSASTNAQDNDDNDGRNGFSRAFCERQRFYNGNEGDEIEICFVLPQPVNTNVIALVTDNGTAERDIDFTTQEHLVLNQTQQTHSRHCFLVTLREDKEMERNEVVSFSLEPIDYPQLVVERSCLLLIQDRTGPNIECFNGEVLPGQPIGIQDIDDPDSFCLRDINEVSNPLSGYFPASDCTKWDYLKYDSLFNQDPEFVQEFVVHDLTTTCLENVKSVLEVLFETNQGDTIADVCSTNCVLGFFGETGSSSVLLLDDVGAFQASEVIQTFRNGNFGLCPMQLQCCLDSVPDICFRPSPPTVATVLVPQEPNGAPVAIIAGASVGAILVIVIVVAVVVIVIAVLVFVYLSKQKRHNQYEYNPESAAGNARAVVYKAKQMSSEESLHNGAIPVVPLPLTNPTYDGPPDYQEVMSERNSYYKWKKVFSGMIVKSSNLRYGEQLGEGAFGKVIKGTLILTSSTKHRATGSIKRAVAIKTLKKASNLEEIEDFIAESAIMLDFNHPNVLRLVGVCFNTDDKSPVIVLPFMANGDLRIYLKSKRPPHNSKTEEAYPESLSEQVFLGMCLEIARGMEYLSTCKFVHRDLAARNCMVDENLGIKVADFGLSREVYHSNYYRLTHRQRLPVKWMAPESLFDNVYTEKTDVWSFGVVCWEIFKFGRKPFSGIDNAAVPDHISEGHRLKKPVLCPDKLYDIIEQTWSEEPEMRPNFSTIVKSLTQLMGYEDDEDSEQHKYFVVEGPVAQGKRGQGEEEEDIGGENIYSELESPVYKNWEKDGSSDLDQALEQTPVMYEVPVPSRQTSSVVPDTQEAVAPCEYEVPLSFVSQANVNPIESGNQPTNKHIYQTLEHEDDS